VEAALRRATVPVVSLTLVLALSACGGAGRARPAVASTTDGFAIGLALPEGRTTRYDTVDLPTVEKQIKQRCARCTVNYVNAKGDAGTQQRQLDTLIKDRVKAIIVDPVDARAIEPSVRKAHSAGIKVVAYDRLAQGPIDAYTSFDNTEIGKEQGEGLLQALGPGTTRRTRIVMIDGAEDDPNAAQFKAGAHSVLDGRVDIAAEYATPGWLASKAAHEVGTAINRFGGSGIAAVYSANDGMAAGVVEALESAGVRPLPPVSGQDAQLDAVQRVVAGTQAFTIYKPYTVEAQTAAQLAVDLATGSSPDIATTTVATDTTRSVPTRLIGTTILDTTDIRQTVVADGLYTVRQICTPQLADACARIGLR
jgi:D-xylose transport system substrate-binding protein